MFFPVGLSEDKNHFLNSTIALTQGNALFPKPLASLPYFFMAGKNLAIFAKY